MVMGTVVLDIGGVDKEPVDRGLLVRRHGDFLKVTVADGDMLATIPLDARELRDLRAALAENMTLEEKATEAFETLFAVINKMVYGDEAVSKALAEMMRRQHRTLIQQWWGMIARTIGAYAKTPDNGFDARNEDSVKWAREVAKVPPQMRFI